MKKTILLLAFFITYFISFAQDVSTFCNVADCYQKEACYEANTVSKQTYTYARVGDIFGNDPTAYKLPLQISVYSSCPLPDASTIPYNPKTERVADVVPTCTGCKRPFILLIHGGGFGFGCKDNLEQECREFASRGYVAASIDYRLGWKTSQAQCYTNLGTSQFCLADPTSASCPETSQCTDRTNLHAAVYKAMQDVNAALRYMAYYADAFNLDVNYFYIGGQSAGSVIATNTTYMNQNEINTLFSELVDINGNNIYGKLNNNGNKLQAEFSLKGLYDCWGAVGDVNGIRGNADKIPMIAFHCEDDNVVPYAHGGVLKIACGTQLDVADGSSVIYNQLKTKYPNIVATEFYHQATGGHGGILNTTSDQMLKRIELAVCFFRKCRMGYTNQVDFDLTNGDNTTVECSVNSLAQRLVSKDPLATGKSVSANIFLSGRNIFYTYALTTKTQVETNIYDISGRQLGATKKIEQAGTYQNIQQHNFTPGVYIATIRYNGRIVCSRKLVISN